MSTGCQKDRKTEIQTDRLTDGVEKNGVFRQNKFSHLNVACHAKMSPFYEILRKTEEKKVPLVF